LTKDRMLKEQLKDRYKTQAWGHITLQTNHWPGAAPNTGACHKHCRHGSTWSGQKADTPLGATQEETYPPNCGCTLGVSQWV
jgi:hypothetical protein